MFANGEGVGESGMFWEVWGVLGNIGECWKEWLVESIGRCWGVLWGCVGNGGSVRESCDCGGVLGSLGDGGV